MANTQAAIKLLEDAHDALAGMADSDLDYFEDEDEEREAVPAQYAARKVMAAIQLLGVPGAQPADRAQRDDVAEFEAWWTGRDVERTAAWLDQTPKQIALAAYCAALARKGD